MAQKVVGYIKLQRRPSGFQEEEGVGYVRFR